MSLFKREKSFRNQADLKIINGERIREQYFNIFIFMEVFIVFIPFAIILTINTLSDGIGTKFNSIADVFEFILLAIKYLTPPVVLSVLNLYVFGEIICVLDDVGITFSGGFIRWDSITDIVYVIDFPTKTSFGCCYARVIGKNLNLKIYSAPVFLLLRAKKYNKNIKVRYSKWSIAMLVSYAVAPSIIMPVIFLLNN